MLTRRHFLQGTGGFLSLAMLANRAQALTAGRPRAAVPADAHFFVFVQVYGAWDVCLAFDPKDRELKLPTGEAAFDQPYAMNEVKELANGIRLPPQGAVLGRLADRLAIVNGIDMEVDNGHFPDNMMAGFQQPRNANLPFFQSVLAKRHPYLKRCSVQHLYASYDGMFFAGPYGMTTVTATAGDFVTFLAPSSDAANLPLDGVQSMVAEYAAAQPGLDRRKALGGYTDAIGRAIQVGRQLKAGGFAPPANVDQPAGLGNLLGQLFATGVLGSATLSFGQRYFFDTHSDHYKDHPLGKALVDVDALCAALAQVPLDEHTSVFDRTTVVLAAEFCRSPRLNGAAGKDHNFRTNSAAVIGYKTRPGVYGASGFRQDGGLWEAHAGQPIDFATGRPKADGQLLKAKNLWAGLGGVAGVDLSHEFGGDTVPVTFLG